jgi:catechol 2,3-dioxygenase-like lactoylglutathione lyase family enzyme
MSEQPQVAGIHHLKVPVSDLARSAAWYGEVLGAVRIPEYDHINAKGELFAQIFRVPGVDTMVELRLAPGIAAGIRGFDPIMFSVELHDDLLTWIAHLNELTVENSGVLRGILGWTLVCYDPDGLSIRFYTNEEHELDAAGSDMASPWLAYPA